MKKLLSTLLLFYCLAARAQYQVNGNSTQTLRIAATSTFSYPTGCGAPSGIATLRGGLSTMAAQYFDSCNNKQWVWNPKLQTWVDVSVNITELDPTVASHIKSITTGNIANWNTGFNFANSYNIANYYNTLDTRYLRTINWTDGYLTYDNRYLQTFTETDPTVASHIKAITTTNISNWNAAFGWGNHSGLYRPITYNPIWNDVQDKPNFATVAVSGSFWDLNNIPSTTLEEVISNNNNAGGQDINNVNNLRSEILHSNHLRLGNSINDATGVLDFFNEGSTIFTRILPQTSITANVNLTLPNATGTIALTSQIPTNNNQLTNGAGYITNAALNGYALTNGSNATGTWPIAITGNAATASNATQWDGNTYSAVGGMMSLQGMMGFDGTNWRTANLTSVSTWLGLSQYVSNANFTWNNLGGKPSTFTPSAHTHVISDVTNLQTELNNRVTLNTFQTISGAKEFNNLSITQNLNIPSFKLNDDDRNIWIDGDDFTYTANGSDLVVASKNWVTGQLSNLVTTNTTQTITGVKDFNNAVNFNGIVTFINSNPDTYTFNFPSAGGNGFTIDFDPHMPNGGVDYFNLNVAYRQWVDEKFYSKTQSDGRFQQKENQRLSTNNAASFDVVTSNSAAYPQFVFFNKPLYNDRANDPTNLKWRYNGTNDAVLLHSVNYTSYADNRYLQLTGGTVSGAVTINGGTNSYQFNQSNPNDPTTFNQFSWTSGWGPVSGGIRGSAAFGEWRHTLWASNGFNISVGGYSDNTSTFKGLRLNSNGDAWFSNDVEMQGIFRSRNNLTLLNKAQNGWLTWATRNPSGAEAVYDLSNIGRINTLNNVVINAQSEGWAEGLQIRVPNSWGGIRLTRSSNGGAADGNWALGYTGYSADDFVIVAQNFGQQVNDIIRLTKSGNVTIGVGSLFAPNTAYEDNGALPALFIKSNGQMVKANQREYLTFPTDGLYTEKLFDYGHDNAYNVKRDRYNHNPYTYATNAAWQIAHTITGNANAGTSESYTIKLKVNGVTANGSVIAGEILFYVSNNVSTGGFSLISQTNNIFNQLSGTVADYIGLAVTGTNGQVIQIRLKSNIADAVYFSSEVEWLKSEIPL